MLTCNCNWFWRSLFIAVVSADLQNTGRGKDISAISFEIEKERHY
jgi:hypothetical protein